MIGLAMENAQVWLTCKPFLFFMPLAFSSNLVVFIFKFLKGYLYHYTMHVLHVALGLM